MLRIHFTSDDIARTRLMGTWGPLAETAFSLAAAHRHNQKAVFGRWRRRVAVAPPRRAESAITSVRDVSWDLFTLTGPAATIDEGLEQFMAAPRARMRTELESDIAFRIKHRPCGITPFVDVGDIAADSIVRKSYADALNAWFGWAVAPHWQRIRAHLDAEVARQSRALAASGVESVLNSLPAGYHWRPPVLEVFCGRHTIANDPLCQAHLGGRGLVLVPSVFVGGHPMLYLNTADESAPPVLFYPALRDACEAIYIWDDPKQQSSVTALTNLLGRTRAAALCALTDPCTTTELARRVGVSAPTASEHTRILREAGLITSHRNINTVLHILTPLGIGLLREAGTWPPAV